MRNIENTFHEIVLITRLFYLKTKIYDDAFDKIQMTSFVCLFPLCKCLILTIYISVCSMNLKIYCFANHRHHLNSFLPLSLSFSCLIDQFHLIVKFSFSFWISIYNFLNHNDLFKMIKLINYECLYEWTQYIRLQGGMVISWLCHHLHTTITK